MRRLLFFLSATATGAGLVILLSAGTGAGLPFGLAIGAILIVGAAVGGRWGRGPVARGVQARYLAQTGVLVVVLCAVLAGMLLWRPSLGRDLPMAWFLGCMALGGILMVPVGRMGRADDPPARPFTWVGNRRRR
jgi:hypothetical protein